MRIYSSDIHLIFIWECNHDVLICQLIYGLHPRDKGQAMRHGKRNVQNTNLYEKGGYVMKRLLAATLALSLICIFSSSQTDALSAIERKDWTPLKKDIYIKEQSITRPSDTTVSLWIKVLPGTGTASLADLPSRLIEKGGDDLRFTYDHTGYLSEIDCEKKKHREWIAILYDTHNNIIHSVQHPEPSWDVIASGSSFDVVQKAVCRYN